MLWIKLEERFKTIGNAFLHFDNDFNNSVSYAEFQKHLDHLRIQFSIEQVEQIYKYLDKDQKGYLTYLDFCRLAEDRRMGLVPEEMCIPFQQAKTSPQNRSKLTKFLDGQDFSQLEDMCRWRTPKHNAQLSPVISAAQNKTGSGIGAKSKIATNGPPPNWVFEQSIAFGRPTDAYIAKTDPDHVKMSSLVKNDYNRRFLNDVIKRNALEMVVSAKNAARTKDVTNRTFHLRANSVANVMQQREMNQIAENHLKFGGGGSARKQMIIDLAGGNARTSITAQVSPKANELRAKLGIQSMQEKSKNGSAAVSVVQQPVQENFQDWSTPDRVKDKDDVDTVTDVGR